MRLLRPQTDVLAALLCLCLSATISARSQGHGGGPLGGGGGGGGLQNGGPRSGGQNPNGSFGQGPGGFPGQGGDGRMGGPPPPGSPGGDGTTSTMRGGLQLGPPGRWWDDKGFAKNLGLRPDQKKRMDDIFNANKAAIISSYQSLQQEEARLEGHVKEPQLSEPDIFAAIDRVAQARAGLEKANAHMLLLIRQQMDQDQLQRLEQHR